MQSKQVWIITDKKINKNQNTTPKIWLLKQSQFMRNASFGNGKKRRCDWPALISHGEESDETKKQQETVDSRLAQNIFQLLKTKSYWHKFTRFWAIWLILKASPTLRIRTMERKNVTEKQRGLKSKWEHWSTYTAPGQGSGMSSSFCIGCGWQANTSRL